MKKIIGVVLFLCLAVLLTGCKNKYHAKIYGKNANLISEEFLDTHRVYHAHYKEVDEDGKTTFVTDETSPKDRKYMIGSQAALNTIITEGTLTVDFSKKIVLVHIIMGVHPNRALVLKSIKVKDDVVNVTYDIKQNSIKDASSPTAVYAVIVMDKVDAHDCNFDFQSAFKYY